MGPKSKRISGKELKRRLAAQEVQRLNFIRQKVSAFKSQNELDLMLMGQEDPVKRKVLFDFLLPFIKFANPKFPTSLESTGGLVSVAPKIIRPPQQFTDDEDKVIRV